MMMNLPPSPIVRDTSLADRGHKGEGVISDMPSAER